MVELETNINIQSELATPNYQDTDANLVAHQDNEMPSNVNNQENYENNGNYQYQPQNEKYTVGNHINENIQSDNIKVEIELVNTPTQIQIQQKFALLWSNINYEVEHFYIQFIRCMKSNLHKIRRIHRKILL